MHELETSNDSHQQRNAYGSGRDGKGQVSVLVLREREKCNKTMVTIDVQNQGNQETVFLAQFRPTPLSLKNSEEASLFVEKGRFAEALTQEGYKYLFVQMKGL